MMYLGKTVIGYLVRICENVVMVGSMFYATLNNKGHMETVL